MQMTARKQVHSYMIKYNNYYQRHMEYFEVVNVLTFCGISVNFWSLSPGHSNI